MPNKFDFEALIRDGLSAQKKSARNPDHKNYSTMLSLKIFNECSNLNRLQILPYPEILVALANAMVGIVFCSQISRESGEESIRHLSTFLESSFEELNNFVRKLGEK